MIHRLLNVLGRRQEDTDDSAHPTKPCSGEQGSVRAEVRADIPVHPEEVVFKLLTDAGGRLRQQTVVEHTGWSKSKVSRTLINLENQEHIMRIRAGREKIIIISDRAPNRESVRER